MEHILNMLGVNSAMEKEGQVDPSGVSDECEQEDEEEVENEDEEEEEEEEEVGQTEPVHFEAFSTLASQGYAHQREYRKRRRTADIPQDPELRKMERKLRAAELRQAAKFSKRCPNCDYTHAYPSGIKRHLARQKCIAPENRKVRYPCENCPEGFAEYNELRKHISIAHPLCHQCPECSFNTKVLSQMKRHFTVNHEKGIECPHPGCGARVHRLRLKYAIHTDTPEHGTFRKHVASHRNPNLTPVNFKDEENNSDDISSEGRIIQYLHDTEASRHLSYPQRKKDNLRIEVSALSQFKCDQCDRGFDQPIRLRRHIKRVHEKSYAQPKREKKFRCQFKETLPSGEIRECDKRYPTPGLLDDHMNLHLGLTPYSCESCNEEFHSRALYAIHLRALHNTSIKMISTVNEALGFQLET